MVGIYKITNLVNNKVYIGKSEDVNRRLTGHKNALLKNKHHNQHLQNAYNKYGLNNFLFEPLLECTIDELNNNEITFINKFKSNHVDYGYNKTDGGDGGKLTLETRKKISTSIKSIMNYEYKIKISEGVKGTNSSRCKNISKSKMGKPSNFKGRKMSEESKRKIGYKSKLNNNAKHLTPFEQGHIPYNKFSLEIENKTKKLLLNGEKVKEIATKLNVSNSYVYKIKSSLFS